MSRPGARGVADTVQGSDYKILRALRLARLTKMLRLSRLQRMLLKYREVVDLTR